jgi:hypothetical protein
MKADVGQILGLSLIRSVELPCTIVKVVKDVGDVVLTAHYALGCEDTCVWRVIEFPIVETAVRVVCGPEIFFDPGRQGMRKEQGLPVSPVDFERLVPRKMVVSIRINALES